jgi:hypothetical protein
MNLVKNKIITLFLVLVTQCVYIPDCSTQTDNLAKKSICDLLSNISYNVVSNEDSCFAIIHILGLEDALDYKIGWWDGKSYIKGNSTKKVFDPGRYQFIVERTDGLCSSQRGVEVPNFFNVVGADFIYYDCLSPHLKLDIDLKKYNVTWKAKDSTGITDLILFNNKDELSSLKSNTEYIYQIETKNGNCKFEASIKTNEVYRFLEITDPVFSDINCTGIHGKITFKDSIIGGALPLHYHWSNGSLNLNQSELDFGDYTLVVTDSDGCSTSKTFNISPFDAYVEILEYKDSCGSLNNGKIILKAKILNGELPYIDWQIPNTQNKQISIAENLKPDDYCVFVTYVNQMCSFEKCFTINKLEKCD